MQVPQDWRNQLDDRQQKEVALAETYVRDFNHGTTGHNQLILVATLAELLDIASGAREPKPPIAPAEIVLTFGKHKDRTLGELLDIDTGYLAWLAREGRDSKLRDAANEVLSSVSRTAPEDPNDIPF